METNYPTLRRPKRKLCYLTNKESVSKQWAGPVTLGDVDRMFDDLDSSSRDGGQVLSSPLNHSDTEAEHSDTGASPVPQEGHLSQKRSGPVGNVMLPATKSKSPELDIDSHIRFKMHGPVKTSSPIEEIVNVRTVEEEVRVRKDVVSPILFDCEEEGKEEAMTEPLTIPKPQISGDDSALQSPPRKFDLIRPTMSSHKDKVVGSRQEKAEGSASPARHEPEVASPEKPSKSFHSQSQKETSTRVGKDMSAFLQMLRDAGKPRPAGRRKLLTPVKVNPPPPEPEDDFLILEDDAPLWFTIPSKTATSKRPKQSGSSSTDKDSSTDKGTKYSTQEAMQNDEELEKANDKLDVQPVNEKMKTKKGREKKNEVTWPGNKEDEFTSPEDVPTGDLVEQEKPIKKKKQLKKIPSKEIKLAEEEPIMEMDEGKQKDPKSSEQKRSKPLKDGKQNAKTSRAKSLKGTRKVMQGPEDVQEAVKHHSEDQYDMEHADVGLDCLSDKQIMNSKARKTKDSAEGKAKQKKLPVVSEGSSSEEGQLLGKRTRKPSGQWWSCCPEGTKVTDNHPTLKRTKQHNKELTTAGPSAVKAEKDKVLKKRNEKQPALSSNQTKSKAKENKIRRLKNRPARGGTPKKTKAGDGVFITTEPEQTEEWQQEEVVAQDLDSGRSSPLDLSRRDLSCRSGDQVFHRVYQHVSNEKMSDTPAPVSPRRVVEQFRAADVDKRRRKPPGNWWTVNTMSDEVESISSQPQQPIVKEPKSRRERKRQPKPNRSPGLGTPKNGNMGISSKPLGGAHVLPLKVEPKRQKTVKRSLALFKDTVTSVSETPTVDGRRDAGQNNRCGVTAGPADEVTVTDFEPHTKTDGHSFRADAGETHNSHPNHGTQQHSRSHPEHILKDLRSGPSSFIDVEHYQKSDSLIVPPSSVPAALSVSDLCAPPLKPLILQPKDKANLREWFKSLWSSTVDSGGDISPDQFDWYFYQGRAMGLLVDLNCGSICSGKILLGSYMKKPLWVDHSATTVFNLLTSSVRVTIDGTESHFKPGQSFMVQCGNAYSVQNVTAQPAVLYFTRIFAEGSD